MRLTLVTAPSLAALVALAACSRASAPGDAGGNADAREDGRGVAEPTLPREAGPAAVALPPDEEPPAMFVGARRARLSKLDDEPGLAKNGATIRAHFGGTLPAAMDLQAVPLASGKQALLLSNAGAKAGDLDPIALVVDATGEALLTKEHPLAGITPPARPFALAPRPDGGLALFFYDEPTKLVAARMSAVDGAPYAELMLYELPRCDAISAAWWKGRGWVVVTSFPGGARAQLLTEDGRASWNARGLPVGEPWRGAAPATIVIDPETSSWLLVQHATRGGSDHVVVLRYDTDGNRLGNPTDLGAIARVAHGSERVEAAPLRPGVVRINVGSNATELKVDSIH
jgi:hypothetical protein